MIYFVTWTFLCILFLFLAILEDKKGKETPKWLNYSILILFFWVLIPLHILDYAYNKYDEKNNA